MDASAQRVRRSGKIAPLSRQFSAAAGGRVASQGVVWPIRFLSVGGAADPYRVRLMIMFLIVANAAILHAPPSIKNRILRAARKGIGPARAIKNRIVCAVWERDRPHACNQEANRCAPSRGKRIGKRAGVDQCSARSSGFCVMGAVRTHCQRSIARAATGASLSPSSIT